MTMYQNEEQELYLCPICGAPKFRSSGFGQPCFCGNYNFVRSGISEQRYRAVDYGFIEFLRAQNSNLPFTTDDDLLKEVIERYYDRYKSNAFSAWFIKKYAGKYRSIDFSNPDVLFYWLQNGLISRQEYFAYGGLTGEQRMARVAAEDKRQNEIKQAKQEAYLQEQARKPKCPACGSENLSRITNLQKGVKAAVYGVWAVGEMSKTFECNHCGYKF